MALWNSAASLFAFLRAAITAALRRAEPWLSLRVTALMELSDSCCSPICCVKVSRGRFGPSAGTVMRTPPVNLIEAPKGLVLLVPLPPLWCSRARASVPRTSFSETASSCARFL